MGFWGFEAGKWGFGVLRSGNGVLGFLVFKLIWRQAGSCLLSHKIQPKNSFCYIEILY